MTPAWFRNTITTEADLAKAIRRQALTAHAMSSVDPQRVRRTRPGLNTYYLKYRHRRGPDYLSAWWEVVTWDVVDEGYEDDSPAIQDRRSR